MSRRVRGLIVLAVLVAAAVGLRYYLTRPPVDASALLASGTVESTEARLGFKLPGRILEINVREGAEVTAGTQLAALDPAEALTRRHQAEAQIAMARSLLEELLAGSRPEEIGQAEAVASVAEKRLADARQDQERARLLFDGGAISREFLDKAMLAVEVSEAQLEQLREQLDLVRLGPRKERVAAQRAAIDQAEAGLETVDVNLADHRLVAPFDGRVTVRHREPGEVVAPGSPVFTLIDPGDRWVRIYVPEDRLGAVQLGGKASILSDTFPDKRYRGEVVYVSPEAEFTPKTVQTQEERVRLVYAVKVRVMDDSGQELKPGMPVDVSLTLEEQTRPEGERD